MNTSRNENLPLDELQVLGLYKDGKLNISSQNIEALLAGRRTELVSLEAIDIDGIQVQKLEAKLSLNHDNNGVAHLHIHPIYNQPQLHPLLTTLESNALINGQKHVISKLHRSKDDNIMTVNIEYDKETKEFVSYDPSRIPEIHQVNGITISKSQQEDFRKGNLVELHDGTKFQHSATDSQGILSDRKRLILSIILDGGLSYLIFRELKNLRDSKQKQTEGLTKGYNESLAKLILADKDDNQKDKTVIEYYNEMNKYPENYSLKNGR